MIRCPRCDVEVEPTWERCAGCGLAAADVTLGDLTRDAGSRDGDRPLGPHTPPPYRRSGDRSSRATVSAVATTVALAVVVVLLAVAWMAHPFGAFTVSPP